MTGDGRHRDPVQDDLDPLEAKALADSEIAQLSLVGVGDTGDVHRAIDADRVAVAKRVK